MSQMLWMAAFYGGVGALLLGYGIWGFRSAKNATTDRQHALGMHAAGFGIPCGALAIGGAITWIIMYASHTHVG